MTKTVWRVETPATIEDFDNVKAAQRYLRKYTEGNIYQIDGTFKRLAYFLSHGRLYTA